MKLQKIVWRLWLLVALPNFIVANDGSLDTTFNGTGQETTDFSSPRVNGAFATSVLIQANNQILVAGVAETPIAINNTWPFSIAYTRYNPDGSFDPGMGGPLTFHFGGTNTGSAPAGPCKGGPAHRNSVNLQSTGQIVIGCTVLTSGTTGIQRFGVARFNNADGSLDTTFNTPNGFLIGSPGLDGSGGNRVIFGGMAIQSDDFIVCAGGIISDGAPSTINIQLQRFTDSGLFDGTFGGGPGDDPGTTSTALGTCSAANAIILQPDQNILITGYSDNKIFVARYTTAGLLDTTFNAGGTTPGTNTIQVIPGTTVDVGNAIALQNDGKIVVAGASKNGAVIQFVLVRFNADGTLDTAFGTSGIVTTQFGTTDDEAFGVALQTDGKIVAAGFATLAETEFALSRYSTAGVLDPNFGTGGKVTTPFSPAQAFAITIQPDAKIVLAGIATLSGVDNFALARYDVTISPTPPPPPSRSCIDTIDALTQAIRNKYELIP